MFGQGMVMKEIMDRSLWCRSAGLDTRSNSHFGLLVSSGNINKLSFGDVDNKDSYQGIQKSHIDQFLEK